MLLFISSKAFADLSNTSAILDHIVKNAITYNLTSVLQYGNKLDLFIAPQELFSYDSKDFDVKYYNFVMENKFMELMKIIMPLYYGKNVIILISDDQYNNIVSESLQKIIQQRYGILAYLIYEIEDLDMISIDKSEFSIQGLYNLDIDKAKYSDIMNSMYTLEQLEEMQRKLSNSDC